MERESRGIDTELKKAIEILKQEPDFSLSYYERERAIDIALNLISKLQKELESQKQGNKDLVKECVKLSAKIVELKKRIR